MSCARRSPQCRFRRSSSRAHDDDTRREALADLHEGIARATRLVEQLLALARSEPDDRTAQTPVDLSPLLDDCVRRYVLVAQERGVDLGVETNEAVIVSGDAEALRVMFDNLIDNATKYTPKGGRVDVSLKIQDGRPVVDIWDSGPGIPQEERERVFDRFYRVGESANRARTESRAAGWGSPSCGGSRSSRAFASNSGNHRAAA